MRALDPPPFACLRFVLPDSFALTYHIDTKLTHCGLPGGAPEGLSPMSLTMNRSLTTAHVDFRADKQAKLVGWTGQNGLKASKQPVDGAYPTGTILVCYGEDVPNWTIYRADGHLWLCSVADRTEQRHEGSKLKVESVEDALVKIIVDTEASA